MTAPDLREALDDFTVEQCRERVRLHAIFAEASLFGRDAKLRSATQAATLAARRVVLIVDDAPRAADVVPFRHRLWQPRSEDGTLPRDPDGGAAA